MSGLLLCDDLILSARVASTARAGGVGVAVCPSADDLQRRLAALGTLQWVILDLTTSGGNPADQVSAIRSQHPAARIVACAPHVQEALLQAAREAGCDLVLTRGQLDHRLTEIVTGA
jgi:DNA-binding NarL/FixJ family response regulator